MSAAEEVSEVAQSAARTYGGITKAPEIIYRETRPVEVIEPTPLVSWAFPAYSIYRMTKPQSLSLLSDNFPTLTEHEIETAEYHHWAAKLWVSEREEYDMVANALICYGYYRVYKFPIWVQTSS